nr:hypothetical protein [Luteimonas sp. Y-2-2-4F]
MRALSLLIATADPYHLLAAGYALGCICMFVGMLAVRIRRNG